MACISLSRPPPITFFCGADGTNLDRQGKDSGVEGYPLRLWSIEVYVLNENGEQVPATLFDKVTYKLHPSFDDRAIQGMGARA
jgi:hypothetical protein